MTLVARPGADAPQETLKRRAPGRDRSQERSCRVTSRRSPSSAPAWPAPRPPKRSRAGFEQRVVLKSAEPERPYRQRPLSGLPRRESERDGCAVRARRLCREDIELRVGATVRYWIRSGRSSSRGGERIAYDRLRTLLAMEAPSRGGSPSRRCGPRRRPLPPDAAQNGDAIRAPGRAGGRLVVVGAGWIGAGSPPRPASGLEVVHRPRRCRSSACSAAGGRSAAITATRRRPAPSRIEAIEGCGRAGGSARRRRYRGLDRRRHGVVPRRSSPRPRARVEGIS